MGQLPLAKNAQIEYEYRTRKAISNSDLSDLARFLWPNGDHVIKAKPSTLYVGTLFHKIVLQPELVEPADFVGVSDEDRDNLAYMYESLCDYEDIMALIHNGQKEVVKFWEHPETRLPCKARIDAYHELTYQIVDLKTTSCKTEKGFLESVINYRYPRQAAFYMNHTPYQSEMIFVGVQKCAPFNVYIVRYLPSDKEIIEARKQINALMKTAHLELSKADGWRPGSWRLKPEDFR